MKKRILAVISLSLSLYIIQAQNVFPDSGYVGIGTLSPDYPLEVDGIISTSTVLISNTSFAIGADALNVNTGVDNIAIGNSAMLNNLSGSYNVCMGTDILEANTSGSFNTALGNECMKNNKNGDNNTAIGDHALLSNKSGNQNTSIGSYCIYDNISGSGNTGVGFSSLHLNTKGSNNTAVGLNSLFTNKLGSNNTALGYAADVSVNNLSNATAIGNAAIVDASNKVRIGNGSVSSIGGQVSWTAFSDARIKNNIQENVPGLAFINLLRPVTYHFDINKQNALAGVKDTLQWEGKKDIEKIQWTGFLAQDVDAAAQKIQYDFSGVDKSGNIMGLRYSEFVVPLVKSVQELAAMNDAKDAQIADMQKQINELQSAVFANNTNDGTVKMALSDAPVTLLGQNVPNPFDQSTLIPFRIPKNCTEASIMITDASAGKIITVIPISCNETHISIEAGQLSPGTYTYTLYVDGKAITTKQMILVR